MSGDVDVNNVKKNVKNDVNKSPSALAGGKTGETAQKRRKREEGGAMGTK